MQRRCGVLIAFTVLATSASPVNGQEVLTPNTRGMTEMDFAPAAAALSDLRWLEGHWQGQALGGTAEEIWSAPSAHAMMGMFRLVEGDSVRFYEFMTMIEEEGSVVLKLKHFNADLTGWEDRDEVQSFPLVQREAEAMHFHGMTFVHRPPDSLLIYLAFRGREGPMREEIFRYGKKE